MPSAQALLGTSWKTRFQEPHKLKPSAGIAKAERKIRVVTGQIGRRANGNGLACHHGGWVSNDGAAVSAGRPMRAVNSFSGFEGKAHLGAKITQDRARPLVARIGHEAKRQSPAPRPSLKTSMAAGDRSPVLDQGTPLISKERVPGHHEDRAVGEPQTHPRLKAHTKNGFKKKNWRQKNMGLGGQCRAGSVVQAGRA